MGVRRSLLGAVIVSLGMGAPLPMPAMSEAIAPSLDGGRSPRRTPNHNTASGAAAAKRAARRRRNIAKHPRGVR